jgi:hypothetical protein
VLLWHLAIIFWSFAVSSPAAAAQTVWGKAVVAALISKEKISPRNEDFAMSVGSRNGLVWVSGLRITIADAGE